MFNHLPSPPSTRSPAPWTHASRLSPSGHTAKHPSQSDVGSRPRPHEGNRGGLRPLEARAVGAPPAAARHQRLRGLLSLYALDRDFLLRRLHGQRHWASGTLESRSGVLMPA
jgi:hypothetical protein